MSGIDSFLDEVALSENNNDEYHDDTDQSSTKEESNNIDSVSKTSVVAENTHDILCAVCEAGGNLICCMGKCLRSFHLNCLGMQETQLNSMKSFHCADCQNKIHRCFSCKSFQLEENLKKCSMQHCGKFYHDKCLSTKSNCKDDVKCRLHTCAVCEEDITDVKLASRCFRCPKAYHLKCRPRDVHNLGHGLFLCIAHVNEDVQLPPLPPELLRIRINGNGRQDGDDVLGRKRDRSFERDIQYTPGLLVRLEGITPGTHTFAIKDALKPFGDVRFIEFDEGGDTFALARVADTRTSESIIRAANSPTGISIPFTRSNARNASYSTREPSYPTARLLTEDEEYEYWKLARVEEKRRVKQDRRGDTSGYRGDSGPTMNVYSNSDRGGYSGWDRNASTGMLNRTASALQQAGGNSGYINPYGPGVGQAWNSVPPSSYYRDVPFAQGPPVGYGGYSQEPPHYNSGYLGADSRSQQRPGYQDYPAALPPTSMAMDRRYHDGPPSYRPAGVLGPSYSNDVRGYGTGTGPYAHLPSTQIPMSSGNRDPYAADSSHRASAASSMATTSGSKVDPNELFGMLSSAGMLPGRRP